jgi:hypothetical protein
MTLPDASYPAPPNEPEEYLCCHRHSSPCIKDYYREALARWKSTVRDLGGDPDAVLKALGRTG